MKHKYKKEYSEEVLEAFIVAAKNKETLREFLRDILTKNEYENVAMRWQIIKRLARGVKQWDIADSLGLGIGTITRGSNELRDREGGFHKLLEILKVNSKNK